MLTCMCVCARACVSVCARAVVYICLLSCARACMYHETTSLSFVFQGGKDIVGLLDQYCTGTNLYIITLCECIAVAWIYGNYLSPSVCAPRLLLLFFFFLKVDNHERVINIPFINKHEC